MASNSECVTILATQKRKYVITVWDIFLENTHPTCAKKYYIRDKIVAHNKSDIILIIYI